MVRKIFIKSGNVYMITHQRMTSASNVDSENPASHVPLANELGNLRNYFAPTSIFGAGMDRNSIGDTLVDRRNPLQLDSAFVQQTKDQIRFIVEDVAKLAHAPIEPNHFVQAVLPKIVSAMGATGAAFWQQLPDLTWRLLGSLSLPNVLLEGEVERERESDELQRGEFRPSPSRQEGFSGPSPSQQEDLLRRDLLGRELLLNNWTLSSLS